MKKKIAVMLLAIFVIAYACKHEMIAPGINQVPVVVTPPTDSTGTGTNNDSICFQSQVLPLYQTYCSRNSGCHSGTGGGDEDGQDVNTTSYFYIMKGIVPKNPSASRYYTIIGHGMPPRNEPAMGQAQVDIIKKWIEQGALNTTCSAGVCDTTKFTYTNSASVIFATYCNGCHGNAPGSGNVVLSSYASAVAAVNSNKQLFLNAINYTAASAQNMPQSGKLSDCQIQQLTKWISKGMPQ